MVLRAGERIFFACLVEGCPDCKIFRATCAQQISIEPAAPPDAACALAPIAKRQTQGIIGESRLNPNRATHAAITQLDLDQVSILDTQLYCSLAADEHRVVPGHFGYRIGPLL